jgi:hypothetical protein
VENLREELEKSLDEAEWEWLMPHAQRDVIVVVDPALDLLDVGVAIASDNTTSVEQLIGKPSPEQLVEWAGDRTRRRFRALIVQPYVLVQDVA